MEYARLFCLLVLIVAVNAKVFTRCQLTRELLKNGFPRTFISNYHFDYSGRSYQYDADCTIKNFHQFIRFFLKWKEHAGLQISFIYRVCAYRVCLIEKESDKNTSALSAKTPKKKFYGLFQIGSEYCKEGKPGGICDITCESLLDEDIKNDLPCAMKVFETQGFKYWPKWEARCKGQILPDIEKCPDWQQPPSRASPPRDKRMILRGKRDTRRNRMLNRIHKTRRT